MWKYSHQQLYRKPFCFNWQGGPLEWMYANEIAGWCFERFGSPNTFESRWEYNCGSGYFHFQHEAEAFEFRLRWC